MKKILVTEKEEELIEAIRNFRKSYPRGKPTVIMVRSAAV